jgi:hypothetical protein
VQAFDVVKRLHRTPDDKDDVAARLELYLMEKQYKLDTQFVMRPFEIFRTAPNRRRSLIAAIMMREDQSLWIFVLTNYGVLVYASLDSNASNPACWTPAEQTSPS